MIPIRLRTGATYKKYDFLELNRERGMGDMKSLKLGKEERYDIDKEVIEKYNIKAGDVSPFTGLEVVEIEDIQIDLEEDMEIEGFDRRLIEDVMDDSATAVDIVVDDRMDMIINNVIEGNIDNRHTFILTDLFLPEDWEYLSEELGNWHLGRAFSSRVNTNEYPVERVKDKQGYAQYRIKTK